MKKYLFCLSFMRLVPTNDILVPENVQNLVKNRLLVQLQAQAPKVAWAFDDPRCEAQGNYSFGMDELKLSASNSIWEGDANLPLQDLLEGKKIYFDHFLKSDFSSAAPVSGLGSSSTPGAAPGSAAPLDTAGHASFSFPWKGALLVSVLTGGIVWALKARGGGGSAPAGPAEAAPTATGLRH